MQFGRSAKIFLGVLNFWPLVFFISFILIFPFVDAEKAPTIIKYLLGGSSVLIVFVMMTFTIIHAMKNHGLTQEMRMIWVILAIIGNVIADPIYWYLYIWKSPNGDREVGKGSSH